MAETRVSIPEGFDFESYINNYEGNTRITRSIFIAKNCTRLSIEGYKLAIQDIKDHTFNTVKYTQMVENLNNVLKSQGKEEVKVDQEWVNNVQKSNKTTLEEMENELKTAKNNLIKGEIQSCLIKLGEFYYKKGDIQQAMKHYLRSRDYCLNSQHIIDMCFKIIQLYLEDNNFSHVIQTYITRAESTLTNISNSRKLSSRLKCYQILALLMVGGADKYKLIANLLTELPFESFESDVMSPNDVGVYGVLFGLIAFNRRDLQQKILNNLNFKNFMQLEPELRELVESFYKSDYSNCLRILEKYKHILKLDYYFQVHVNVVIQLVREKSMIQYCLPYSMIDMNKMASSFNLSVQDLELELIHLIIKEKISARIDSHNKILCTKKQEKRVEAFDKSILIGQDYEKSTKALLLRLNLLKSNLIVK